jgi:hypothetical protein
LEILSAAGSTSLNNPKLHLQIVKSSHPRKGREDYFPWYHPNDPAGHLKRDNVRQPVEPTASSVHSSGVILATVGPPGFHLPRFAVNQFLGQFSPS